MSLLALGFFLVCGLLVLNLLTAIGLRVTSSWRTHRERIAAPRIADKVAQYAVGESEEFWPPRRRYEHRLLREALMEMVGEVSGEAHERLVKLFTDLGYVEEAERDLHSSAPMDRVQAAEALGEMGARRSLPLLLAGLADEDPLVRYACAQGLASIGAVDSILPILRAIALGGAPNPGVTADILLGFGSSAAEEARELLPRLGEPRIRWLVAVVLGELHALEAVPELLHCLNDPDEELCARACHALGKIGSWDSALALAGLVLSDRPWFVHTAAAGACGQVGNPAAAEALVTPLDDQHWHVRTAAARSLVALGDPGLDAVAARVGSLSHYAVHNYWGTLDVEGGTAGVVERAAAGDEALGSLVEAAHGAGATARLEEVAAGQGDAAGYAAGLLEGGELAAPRERAAVEVG